jgi:hypothetical protein
MSAPERLIHLLLASSLVGLLASTAGTAACAREPDVVRRYDASEATQAVALDAEFFYAIGSAEIGKYDKNTGQRVAGWKERPGGPVAHLNSGIVVEQQLYCAHSNFPETPMVSSIEVFDPATMTHVRSMALPSGYGSATWIERTDRDWWVTFAHYSGSGGEPGRGSEHTRLVRFDSEWRPTGAWSFPSAVVERWDGMSSSGGVWLRPGRFLTTGHHAPEVYVLDLPASGTELVLRETLASAARGQGIAIDRASELLYSIQRDTRQVLVSRLPPL